MGTVALGSLLLYGLVGLGAPGCGLHGGRMPYAPVAPAARPTAAAT